MELAGFGRRYLALVLDILFLEILGMVLSPLNWPAGAWETQALAVPWPLAPEGGTWENPWFRSTLFLAGLWSWYFACFHGWAGQTPGKRLMRVWLRHKNGGPVGFLTALGRFWAGWLLALLSLGLEYGWAAWDPWGQAWHDKLFDTLVIQPSQS